MSGCTPASPSYEGKAPVDRAVALSRDAGLASQRPAGKVPPQHPPFSPLDQAHPEPGSTDPADAICTQEPLGDQ